MSQNISDFDDDFICYKIQLPVNVAINYWNGTHLEAFIHQINTCLKNAGSHQHCSTIFDDNNSKGFYALVSLNTYELRMLQILLDFTIIKYE